MNTPLRGKYGYFININNYIACENCSPGYDAVTMLCDKPYYYHMDRKVLRPEVKSILKGGTE